jgi:hypothetical protein
MPSLFANAIANSIAIAICQRYNIANAIAIAICQRYNIANAVANAIAIAICQRYCQRCCYFLTLLPMLFANAIC